MTKRTKGNQKVPEYPKVMESFNDPSPCIHVHREPFAINEHVAIRRFRITVEPIEEPIEVLVERIRKLWVECDNHHLWLPLMSEAGRLGITLDIDDFGKDRRKL